MLVERILFDLEALHALEGLLDGPVDVGFGDLHRLRFDVTPAADFDTATFALRDGVVGVVIGKFEDGSPALEALERDVDVAFGHSGDSSGGSAKVLTARLVRQV
jgi:hypothetical protein